MLVATIGACFVIEVTLAKPDWGGIAAGFIPRLEPGALYVAIGIIGATVMPHNLYLHSSLVQSRAVSNTYTGKREAARFNLIDSFVALNAAFFVNAAILIVSAATFHSRGILVTEIQQAHELLKPLLGTHVAPVAFALALLASGQSSTLTGTISGQVVMEGYLNLKMRPWIRRLLTRGIALIPAVLVIAARGREGTYQLLILSQVILSLQLPFAVIPLIHFTSDAKKMGPFANKTPVKALAWAAAATIVALNLKLVLETLTTSLGDSPLWLWGLGVAGVLVLIALLLYVTLRPLLVSPQVWAAGILTTGRRIAQRIKPVKIKNIGVALEHSDGDGEIVSAAVSLANLYKAKLTLLHVVETPGAIVLQETGDLHTREDYAYVEELAREIEREDLPVETWLHAGKPADQITRAIQELGLDMLVLGSHGHKGVQDLVFGQTVNSLRHAISIPVLIVRIPDFAVEKPQKTA
jgi:manganese transport protein